ncbi:MAG: DUF5103 domain-containing protein [Paludibacteraceae bacterium]|nr:DUF5103 domain-containing protein [Paludibacteraceae bacterium]
MKQIILCLTILLFPIAAMASAVQTCTVAHTIRSLRVQYLSEALAEYKSDPVRPYLTLPTEEIIDGSDPANTLHISFDELSHNIRQYAYTIRHLTADFQPDDLQSFEYVRGFTRNDITDYATSLNTSVNYTHYTFTFPNEDMQILVSGNYQITIYDADQGEEAVAATVVFSVVEPMTTLNAKVTPNTIREISGRYQQLDIDLNINNLHVVSPTDIKLLVRQNDRIDNQVYAPYPTYVEANRLRWKDHSALVFEGGNEYRHLDIWSTYFAGNNVDRIRHDKNDYHAFLFADPIRGTLNPNAGRCGTNYMHEFDHNGTCIINAERCVDIDTEAEYMYVHWTLPIDNPIFDGSIYIGGDLFNNQMVPTLNRMLYDNEQRCYYFNALLKQGGYDYQYWFKKKGEPSATVLMTEGSHWQTENVYTIYVFFRSVSDRYDRLVGLYHSSSST